MSLSGEERFQQISQQNRTQVRGWNSECQDIMMPGASDQKVLDFKPRNEHRRHGSIWVTDYQKHNSEKLIKYWHVKMLGEGTTGNIWRADQKVLKNVNEEHTLKKSHTWKPQINMSIWYTSQYPKEFLSN